MCSERHEACSIPYIKLLKTIQGEVNKEYWSVGNRSQANEHGPLRFQSKRRKN